VGRVRASIDRIADIIGARIFIVTVEAHPDAHDPLALVVLGTEVAIIARLEGRLMTAHPIL